MAAVVLTLLQMKPTGYKGEIMTLNKLADERLAKLCSDAQRVVVYTEPSYDGDYSMECKAKIDEKGVVTILSITRLAVTECQAKLEVREDLSNADLNAIVSAADEVISAIAGENEEVHPNNSTKMCELWDDLNDRHAPPEVVRAMGCELLAYREARKELVTDTYEPVALRWRWCDNEAQWTYAPANKMPEFVAAGFTRRNGVEIEYLYAAPPSPLKVVMVCLEQQNQQNEHNK